MDKETLEDHLRKATRRSTARLPEDRVFALGRDLARELAAAHAERPPRHPSLEPADVVMVDGAPRLGAGQAGDEGEDIFRLGALLTALALGRPAVPAWRLDGPPRRRGVEPAAPGDPRRPRLAAPERALRHRRRRSRRAGVGGLGDRGGRLRRGRCSAAIPDAPGRGLPPPPRASCATAGTPEWAPWPHRPSSPAISSSPPPRTEASASSTAAPGGCWRRSRPAPRSSPPPPWPAGSSMSAPTTARWWGSGSRTGASATARRSARWCARRRWPPADW